MLAAYHQSFLRTFRLLGSDTPLAYLSLVPLVMLGVSLAMGRARSAEMRLPDRQVDWMIGFALVLVAIGIAQWLPRHLSFQAWTGQFDLLGLPFFVAGTVALIYGSRGAGRR